jgi:outer membrane lipoprotein-sorting protein
MKKLLAVLLVASSTLGAHAADDKMFFAEYRVVSETLPATSPELQPRKIWRLGKGLLRFEDVTNPETKTLALIIVDEPNVWIIDRNKNEGKHVLDPGPQFVVHFPIFPREQSEKLKQLEFGSELSFFQENGAKELAGQTVNGIKCKVYRLELDNRKVTLFMKPDKLPLQIEVQSADVKYAVRFLKYDPNQKPDMNLFKVPPGIKIIDP